MAYTLAGLHLISEIALSGVATCADDLSKSEVVRIRQTSVPKELNAPIATYPDAQWNGEELLITISGIARYLVSADEIDFEPFEGAGLGDVRAYLLGTVFGALCHLRGIFPLHASTIELVDRCVAFTGDTGAGKSTMAASLIARGHRLISDDVTYFRRAPSGRLEIWPGTTRLRLWESAMEGLGYGKEGVEREFRGFDKFLLPASSPDNADCPRRLHAIYQLVAAPSGAPVEIEQLRGASAMEALLQNTYRLFIAEDTGRKSQVFAVCAEVARNVPVFRLRRPKDFGVLDAVLSAFERHSAEIAAAS